MKSARKFLGFDIGASNGRAVVGIFDGKRLTTQKIHHFLNEYVCVNDSLHWDVLRLFLEIKKGLGLFTREFGKDLAGIGVDTWGVDFGLFDREGKLIGNPYHYRDKRTEGMVTEIDSLIDGYKIYETTGVKLASINTICQLYSTVRQNSPQLKTADFFLMMPCLFNYFLSGEKFQEHSIMTPTGLYDVRKDQWAKKFLKRLGIPANLMLEAVKPGMIIGKLQKSIREEMRLEAVSIIAPATHDTASAVISVPADESTNWAFLSCGTWSVLGIETKEPVTTKRSYELNITNAATAEGKFMTIFNITGLWILQECKKMWEAEGKPLEWLDLLEVARNSKAFTSFIDVDDAIFASPTNMLAAIADYCRNTSQSPPEDKGAVIRLVLESMAFKYKEKIPQLEKLTGKKIDILHIVGGGVRNSLLCQFTANSLGIPVLAGPFEAAATGNILMQMKAVGTIDSVSQGRALLRKSINLIEYAPKDTERWNEVFSKYQKIAGGI